ALTAAERDLGRMVPPPIRELLSETDGVLEVLLLKDGRTVEIQWLVWRLADFVDRNRDGLHAGLAVGDAGADGLTFVLCGYVVPPLYPMERVTIALAGSLDEFIAGWLGGAITV